MTVPFTTVSILEKVGLVMDGDDFIDMEAINWDSGRTPAEQVKAMVQAKIPNSVVVKALVPAIRDVVNDARRRRQLQGKLGKVDVPDMQVLW
jgi:hypothetical protein